MGWRLIGCESSPLLDTSSALRFEDSEFVEARFGGAEFGDSEFEVAEFEVRRAEFPVGSIRISRGPGLRNANPRSD